MIRRVAFASVSALLLVLALYPSVTHAQGRSKTSVVAGCQGDADCKGGRTCVNATCVTPSGCAGDFDCKLGRICAEQQCVWPQEAVAMGNGCRQDSECKGNRVCDTGRCTSRATSASPAPQPAAPPPPPAVVVAPSAPPPALPTTPVDDIAYTSSSPQAGAYALVVGIEHYRDIPAPDGARRDAERFATLLKRTLGLREQNVHLITDEHATRTDILGQLEWLKATVTPGSRVYFYFSGHGAPDVATSSSFLLPYDADTKRISGTGISMAFVAHALSETRARDALAVVDSCFSGAGGRSVLPPGARPLVRMKETAPTAKLALFTASAGDEISGPRPGGHEGLFTRTVTEALATGAADVDGDGQVSLAELSSWVGPRVARDAKRDSREQHPQLIVGAGVDAPGNFVVAYGYASRR